MTWLPWLLLIGLALCGLCLGLTIRVCEQRFAAIARNNMEIEGTCLEMRREIGRLEGQMAVLDLQLERQREDA